MYFVYFIRSEVDGSYYIGYTTNIRQRLKDHNQGKTKSIKHKIPFKLVYIEIYCNKTITIKREIELKNNSFKKQEIIDRLNIMAPSSSG